MMPQVTPPSGRREKSVGCDDCRFIGTKESRLRDQGGGRYFTLQELLRSDVAAQYHIDNTPTDIHRKNLETLVKAVLDPIRERWGSPILVSSGYRCPELNRKVGGVDGSFHLYGMAADIYPKEGGLDALYALIGRMFIERQIGITECYIDSKRGYIHIAHNCEEFNEWPFIEK